MRFLIVILILSSLSFSCGNLNDYKLSPQQLYTKAYSAANDNNEIITAAEEIVDLTANALVDEGMSNGRSSSGRWSSLARSCSPSVDNSYLTDRTHYDTILYVGTITIDYGNGESCIDSDYKRKGKIIDDFEYIFNYKNENFLSKETITFQAFKKDSVQIDGKFFIHSKSGDPVTIETDQATITYPDGKSAVWKCALNFSTIRNEGRSQHNTITGTISGTTRRYESFNTTTVKPVEYNYDCDNLHEPVPIKGSMLININGDQVTLDYGDGSCDNVYNVTIEDQ